MAGTALLLASGNAGATPGWIDDYTAIMGVSATIESSCSIEGAGGNTYDMDFGTITVSNHNGGGELTLNPDTQAITRTTAGNIVDFTDTGEASTISTSCAAATIAFECVGEGDTTTTGCVIGTTNHRLKNITKVDDPVGGLSGVGFGGTLSLGASTDGQEISGDTFRVKVQY